VEVFLLSVSYNSNSLIFYFELTVIDFVHLKCFLSDFVWANFRTKSDCIKPQFSKKKL